MLDISLKNQNVLVKYLLGLHVHLWKQVMLFKIRWVGEAYVHAKYLDNKGLKNGKSSGWKQKEKQDSSREGKKKWKGGKGKNTTSTTH